MADSAFTAEADFEQTTLDYLEEQFDKWIGAPFKILWSDYRGKVGIFVVVLYVLMGTVGPMVVRPPEANQGLPLVQPFQNMAFPLGTDGLGQDLLALMVHATPAMLKMMLAGAIFGNFVGITLGMISGYYGGTVDKVIMTFTDTIGSIPGIPLLLILAAILEPRNPFLVGVILNINGWAGGARGIRSQVLPLVDEEYVEASRAMGEPVSNILLKEILPNLLPLIFIGFLGGATAVITLSVGLYFLGILPFTTLNWGVVLNYAYKQSGAMYSIESAHWLLVPLVTITGLTFGLTLLAQSFDQVFNPRVRARHLGRERSAEAEEEEEKDVDAAAAHTEMGGMR
jgi:peptide/nickel transport system permease protein